MWARIGRAALWFLSVLLVAIGGGLLHAAFSGRPEPVTTTFGLAFALTGAAIYWHVLRVP